MKINELAIPSYLIHFYEQKGITELYPPQISCFKSGALSGENILIAIPTASGKTLVAEIAMHQHCANGGKCLYIVPLKALASEKFDEFSGKELRIGIATGDYDKRDDFLGKNDVIVATSEKVDSLLRNNATWLSLITLLVVDEVHLLDSPDRGPTLEMIITKLRIKNPSMQIMALSATIGNPQDLADWLGAALVTSNWRPVELRQGVFYRSQIVFPSRVRNVEVISKFDDINLVLDTVKEGGQCLVFVGSRRNAESFAQRIAAAFHISNKELTLSSHRIHAIAETEMERKLAECVALGAAFHHAGLGKEVRRIIEDGFRRGELKCIASTPTLAAGLNLPARRVVIRDYLRYEAGEGMCPIPVREYHQMAGRAGRPGLDPYGEAVLIAKEKGDVERLTEMFIDAQPENVESRCANAWALCTHILSLIATRFSNTEDDLIKFLEQTFYSHQKGDVVLLKTVLDQSLSYLTESEMVSCIGSRILATEYGSLVSRFYLDPRSAEIIVKSINGVADFSEVSFLHLICTTPDMPTLNVRRSDFPFLDNIVQEVGDSLWQHVPLYGEEGVSSFYRSLKTALLLSEWSKETGEAMICERFGVGPGDIYTMVESVQWLIHASARLARMFKPSLVAPISIIEQRVKYGVKPELLSLIALRGIGRIRARRLYNNGITDIETLRTVGKDRIVPILGAGIAAQIFTQLEDIGPSENLQSSLGEFE